jgi:hypothetical protein
VLEWLPAPILPGWYILHRRSAQFSDFRLVRFENGQCFTEIGAPSGTPTTAEFKGAKWLGPVERPHGCRRTVVTRSPHKGNLPIEAGF